MLSPRHTTLKKKKQERQNPHHHGTEIRVMSRQSLNKVNNKLACQMVLGAGESLGIAGRGHGVYSCSLVQRDLVEFSVGEADQAAAVTAGPAYGSHLRRAEGQIAARWGGGRGLAERRDAWGPPKPRTVRAPERRPCWRPRTPQRRCPLPRKPAPAQRACAVLTRRRPRGPPCSAARALPCGGRGAFACCVREGQPG